MGPSVYIYTHCFYDFSHCFVIVILVFIHTIFSEKICSYESTINIWAVNKSCFSPKQKTKKQTKKKTKFKTNARNGK